MRQQLKKVSDAARPLNLMSFGASSMQYRTTCHIWLTGQEPYQAHTPHQSLQAAIAFKHACMALALWILHLLAVIARWGSLGYAEHTT